MAVFFLIFFERFFIAFFARLLAGFNPAGAVPVNTTVSVEIFLIFFFRTEQQRNAVMAPRYYNRDFRRQAYDSVAAKTVAEQRGVPGCR